MQVALGGPRLVKWSASAPVSAPASGPGLRVGRHPHSDGGSISAFVALLLVALVALAGLVVDGGAAVSAHQAAVDEAEQAARAGAGALSVDALRSGSLVIDQDAAIQSAESFMSAAGHSGTAAVRAGTVTASIHYRIPTSVLGIVGITSLPVSATASAVDVHGVTVGTP